MEELQMDELQMEELQLEKTDEEEIEKSIKEKLEEFMENVSNKIPEKYSKAMVNCLKEFATVIPMLKDMGMEEYIWSRNLLVAIDPGYG